MNKKYLSIREEQIMSILWREGPRTIRQIQSSFADHLHFNSISTFVRGLEKHGFVKHKEGTHPHVYEAMIGPADYLKIMVSRLRNILPEVVFDDYFERNNVSYK